MTNTQDTPTETSRETAKAMQILQPEPPAPHTNDRNVYGTVVIDCDWRIPGLDKLYTNLHNLTTTTPFADIVHSMLFAWDEADHPRDSHGRFGEGDSAPASTDTGKLPPVELPAPDAENRGAPPGIWQEVIALQDQRRTDEAAGKDVSKLDAQIQMLHDTARQGGQAYEGAVNEGIARGQITEKEARDTFGIYNVGQFGGDWADLPDTMWHVTTNAPGVEATGGLRTREELAMKGMGEGLGGGSEKTISFTDSRETADRIHEAIIEGHDVARGAISGEDLLTVARTGESFTNAQGITIEGAKEPFIDNMASYWNANRQPGEPLPPGMEKLFSGTSPEDRLDAYKNFATWRQFHGGPEDPLFFGTDANALATMDPAHVKTLTVEPTVQRGIKMGSLGEYRTISGKHVRIVDGLTASGGPSRRTRRATTEAQVGGADRPGVPIRRGSGARAASTSTSGRSGGNQSSPQPQSYTKPGDSGWAQDAWDAFIRMGDVVLADGWDESKHPRGADGRFGGDGGGEAADTSKLGSGIFDGMSNRELKAALLNTPSTGNTTSMVEPLTGEPLTNTEVGETAERLLSVKMEAELTAEFGRGKSVLMEGERRGHFDWESRTHGLEIKTTSIEANQGKPRVGMKAYERQGKLDYADEVGKAPVLLTTVLHTNEDHQPVKATVTFTDGIENRYAMAGTKLGEFDISPREWALASLDVKHAYGAL